MLVSEACNTYLAHCEQIKKLSAHSVNAYRRDLETFKSIVGGNADIELIDRKSINSFIDASFSRGLSEATVKRRIACIKCLFKWLESEGEIVISPFHQLDVKIRIPQRLPRNLSPLELNKILSVCRSKLRLPRNTEYLRADFGGLSKRKMNEFSTLLCTEVLFTTGIRVGELIDVQLPDIFLEEQYIHIRGKGRRERRVFVTDTSIRNLIDSYIYYRSFVAPNHNNLLVNSIGRPASTQVVRIWLRKISEEAQLSRRATPHMYRHSAATQLLSSGVDITYVQKLLGHQSIETTQLYAHVSHADVLKNVAEANIRRDIL